MPQQSDQLCTRLAVLGKQDAQRSAPATLNEAARTVGVVLATESPVPMWDWNYGRVEEVLLMSGVILPESGQAPLLDSHNRWSVGDQLGSLRSFAVNGDALYSEAHFSDTAEKAFTLVREGHLRDVSVGYRIHEQVFVPENTTQVIAGKTFTGPIKVVTRWEVKEGSFTPIGADKNAKTRAASDGQNREEKPMPMPNNTVADQGRAANNNDATPETQVQRSTQPIAPESPVMPASEALRAENPAPAVAPAPPAPSADSIRAEIADIMEIGRMHGCMELAYQAVRSGAGVDMFRAQVLNHITERSAAHAPSHSPHIEVGRGDGEKFRDAASDALCLRYSPMYVPREMDPSTGKYAARALAAGAYDLRGFTLRELARECLRRAGLPTSGDPMDVIGRAFTESTSDFPNILASTAHKSLRQGFTEAAETFEIWTGISTANDFREHTGVDLNGFDALTLVREGGEYTTGSISDRGVRYAVATYGKLFSITRQAVINDDVNAFTKIPEAMGRAAMRTRGNAVYGLLIDNPKTADGNQLFSAAHGNLATSGGPIGKDTYKAGVVAMGTRKGDKGEVLNIAPQYIIVPVTRQDEARILLNSQMIGTQTQPNQENPWKGTAEIVTEGRLDMVDKCPWFMAGPKGYSINVAYLFGNKDVRIEQRLGWTVDGVQFKVSSDFGVYVESWEGLYKNPGN